jgi:hypothetical protein
MTSPDSTSQGVVAWLLEPENPAVRYRALSELLDRPADDAEVRAAEAALPTHQPLAQLLAAQKPDGYWVKRDYYLPKCDGTFWVLSALGDVGLTAENEHARRGCDFMFTFQRDHGGFCRRRRIRGRGLVWVDQPGPCTHARIIRFLIQFGYADDARTRAGVRWLLTTQRDDGMWHCRLSDRYGCLRATHDALRVAALDAEMAAEPATARAAAVVRDLLMEPRMARYHVKELWDVLEYPYFGYSLISALDTLAQLGHTAEQPKIAGALDYLRRRRLPDGRWPLDQRPNRLPFDVGQPGEPSKWLTLDILQVFKRLGVEP